MQYSNEIEINLSRDKVIELFDNPDNMKHWQPGFVSFEHISGEKGQPGAKSKVIYLNGKRRVEMIETLEVRNLPEEFSGSYEMPGMKNNMQNYFYEIDSNKTKWVSNSEFIASSLIMKLFVFMMPKSFKKQSKVFMDNFKDFAENGKSLLDNS